MPQILEENIEHKTLEYQDKVYCVHRVDKDIVKQINNLPPDVLLTFDDCLYSQYYYADKIINQNRIYFCCPTLINNSNTFICKIPKEYCFPFNRHNERLVEILKQYGFSEFYDDKRIEIS